MYSGTRAILIRFSHWLFTFLHDLVARLFADLYKCMHFLTVSKRIVAV